MSGSPVVFLAASAPELQEVAVHVRQTLGALGCEVAEGGNGFQPCAAAVFLVDGSAETRAKAVEGLSHPSPGIKVRSILVPHPKRLDEEQEPAPASGLAEGFHEVRMWREVDILLANLAEEVMQDGARRGRLLGVAVGQLISAWQMMGHWGRR